MSTILQRLPGRLPLELEELKAFATLLGAPVRLAEFEATAPLPGEPIAATKKRAAKKSSS